MTDVEKARFWQKNGKYILMFLTFAVGIGLGMGGMVLVNKRTTPPATGISQANINEVVLAQADLQAENTRLKAENARLVAEIEKAPAEPAPERTWVRAWNQAEAISADQMVFNMVDLAEMMLEVAQEGAAAAEFAKNSGVIKVAQIGDYTPPTEPLFKVNPDDSLSFNRMPIDLFELLSYPGVRLIAVHPANIYSRMTGQGSTAIASLLNQDWQTRTVSGLLEVYLNKPKKGQTAYAVDPFQAKLGQNTAIQGVMLNLDFPFTVNEIGQAHYKTAVPRKNGTKIPDREDFSLWFAFPGNERSFPVSRFPLVAYPGLEKEVAVGENPALAKNQ